MKHCEVVHCVLGFFEFSGSGIRHCWMVVSLFHGIVRVNESMGMRVPCMGLWDSDIPTFRPTVDCIVHVYEYRYSSNGISMWYQCRLGRSVLPCWHVAGKWVGFKHSKDRTRRVLRQVH